MKFIVSSSELSSHLQTVSKVVPGKPSLPILDHLLFELEKNKLTITASDLETTIITALAVEYTGKAASIALPAKILLESIKRFAEQPLTFNVDPATFGLEVIYDKGKFNLVGQNSEDFPRAVVLNEEKSKRFEIPSDALLMGIGKTLFATADDELRPVMNGILFDLTPEVATFVASDTHKLVRYRRLDVKPGFEGNFILPKKPANFLKNILKGGLNVAIEFDDKNACFTTADHRLICRLIEGKFPAYGSVIPKESPNRIVLDRGELHEAIGRVSLFSNAGSNLVTFDIAGNELTISAQDIDFSLSSVERMGCQNEGENIKIGFKSNLLMDILTNLYSPEIVILLTDSARAGLFLPLQTNEKEDELMLLMPMMINA